MKLTPWLRSLKSGIARALNKTKVKRRETKSGMLAPQGIGGELLEDRTLLNASAYFTNHQDGVYSAGFLLQPQPNPPIALGLDPRGVPAIPIVVTFQGAVTITGTGGVGSAAAVLTFNTTSNDPSAPNFPGVTGFAYYLSGDQTAVGSLTFWYEVRNGENTPGPLQPNNGDLHVTGGGIIRGGCTITDSNGPVLLNVLPPPPLGEGPGTIVDLADPSQIKHIFIDTQPIVLDIDSTTPDSVPYNIDPSQGVVRRPYRVGDEPIHIQVYLSEPVAITGAPELVLQTDGILGAQLTDGRAIYVSGSGTSILNLDYVINPGDSTFDLDTASSTAFQLPAGASVRDQDFVQDPGLLGVSAPTNGGLVPGQLGAHRTIQIDTLLPLVGPRPDQPVGSPFTGVTSLNANGTYGAGQTLTIRISFNEAIVLTGAPTLVLATGPVNREATFAGFDGTDTLLFTYTVQPGDSSSDLDYVGPGSLLLNGGSLTDLAGNAADLTLPAPGAVGSLSFNKDIVIDTIVAVTNVTTTVPSGSYGIGQVIPIQVIFNKPVTVFGTPQLILDLDSPTDSVVVNYSTGSGSQILTFNYTIQAGHNTSDLDYISAFALQLNGGAIVDTIGNGNAILDLPIPGAQGSLGFNKNILIDTNLPVIATVSAGASVPDGTYVAGQTLPITVTFNEPVSVTGTPQITLDTNGILGVQPFLNPGETADAVINFTSGSGTTTLTFNYTIAQGQNSLDLDALFLTLINNSQIRDLAGNQIAPTGSILTLPQFPNEPLINANVQVNIVPVAQIDDVVVGSVNVGATYQFSVGANNFSVVATPSDTQATIATKLRQQVNASGATVTASGFGNTVRLTAKTAGAGFTVIIPVGSGLTSTTVRSNVMAQEQIDTITITGVSAGTVYDLVINGIPLSYTASGSDTVSTVAVQIRDRINMNATLASQVTATVNGAVVTVAVNNNMAGTPLKLSTGHSLAGNRNLVIDTAPVITNVIDVTDPDGIYVPGNTLSIEVQFTEDVVVTGTPTLILETNGIIGAQAGSDAEAIYTSGSGTNTLLFLYTIGADQTSVDLNYASTLSLILNGGSIQDLDGNPANFSPSLPALDGAGSLAFNNNLQIDSVNNDPPVNFVPIIQTTIEDVGGLVFSTGNNNLIQVKDVDAGAGDIKVTLMAAFGTLNVPVTGGLTSITGNGTANVELIGTLATINTRLDGLVFTPNANVNSSTTSGSISLQITTDDQGNTGGPALTDTDTVLFNVIAVNDVPVANGQTVQTAVGTAITVTLQATDADQQGLAFVLDPSISPSNGTLSQVPGSNTVIYTPNAGFVGTDSFGFTASDGVSTSNTAVITINVVPTVTSIGFPDITVNEGNAGITNATFTITLSHAPKLPVSIDFNTVAGTAIAGVDYGDSFQSTPGTVTFIMDQQTATFTVPIIGDLSDEPGETFSVVLSNGTNVVILDGNATATIQNDDGLSIGDATSTEGDNGTKIFTFDVRLSSPSPTTVTVNYQTVDGTASQNSDYNNQNGQITFIPGEVLKTISITVNSDVINEADETFFVNLLSPVGASLGKSQGIGTILNDDSTPNASISDVAITEGNSGTKIMSFLVTLSSISGQTVTVDYATQDSTALAGNDYFAASGTVTFTPGQTTQQISVQIIGDQVVEPDDNFFVNLTNPVNASLSDNQATATILNDDGLAVTDVQIVEGNSGTKNLIFTVTAPQTGGQTVSVDYSTSPGTATPGVDYTSVAGTLVFSGGATSRTITVPIVGDFLQEGDETFFLNLSNPVNAPLLDDQALATITDDDLTPTITATDVSIVEGNSGTKNAVFTLTLSAAIGIPVTVDYSTFDISTTAGADYVPVSGTATFQAFQTTTTINVPILGDILDESSEQFRLHLSNATNAIILTPDPIGTILDDDATPTLSINDLSINEGQAGQTQATFTVSLSAPSGQLVMVNFQTADGTAINGNIPGNNSSNDYVSQSGTLTFTPGVTSQTITVTINGDTLFELDETFAINLSGASNASIVDNQAVGTIVNDDAKPTIVISDATDFEGNSGTTPLTFTISLLQPSALSTTVSYSTSSGTALDGNDYQTASNSVTFAPGETSKTVTINVIGDQNVESDENFFVNLSSAVNGVIGDSLGVGTIRNDDVLPSLVVSDATLVEGDGGISQMVFTVTRLNANSQSTTVQFSTSNGTATAGSDYNLTQGTLTFLANETTKTVSVPIIGNTTAEANETFFLNLSNPSNATIADGQGLGTITNDDNAPPAVTVPVGPLTVAEETNLSIIGISVSDPDAGAATITVTVSVAHGTLTVRNDVPNGLTGAQILNNGTGSVTLVAPIVTINSTLASANGVVYRGFTDFFGSDTLLVEANDLGNTGNSNNPLSDTKAVNITVQNVNDAPAIGFSGPGNTAPVPVNSTKGNAVAAFGSPNVLTLTDTDNTNFNGGTITVENLGPFIGTKDLLSVRNQGTSAGLIGFRKGKITYGGQEIGTAFGGLGNSPLVITLNSRASVAAVSALMKNITFGTKRARLTALPRTVSMVMTDGSGGTSNTVQTTVNVTN